MTKIIEEHGIDGYAIFHINLSHCDFRIDEDRFELIDYMGIAHEPQSVIKESK
tara:strand:+ start:255 stop:413 length:159 start_codon:yes stop_codon:yes gene_type:complete